MPRIHPFRALRPLPNIAAQVASVPYDTISTPEARALAEGRPHSFLHVVRPEIDLAPDADPHGPEAHRQARVGLDRLRAEGVLVQESEPTIYLYRMAGGGHRQIGIVACCEIGEYESGVIRKHELTRPDKEDDRTRHLLAAGAHTEPLVLAHADDPELDDLVRNDTNDRPLFHFVAPDGVTHTIWTVRDPGAYVRILDRTGPAWIADGHHRTAAASRAAAERTPLATGEIDRFLSVIFPISQLRILPYHRLILDLGDHDTGSFRAALASAGMLEPIDGPDAAADEPGVMSVYLDGAWSALRLEPTAEDPVSRLDVQRLQDRVFGPALGVEDPRTDHRLAFVGGARGTAYLAEEVDAGRAAVAFAMRATTMEELRAVADAGLVMSPKSTWFDPKPRSGLLVHPFEADG